MKKNLICAPVLCLLLTACFSFNSSEWHAVKGSGKVISETRPLAGFDRVALAGSGHLAIIQDNQESLTIETDDNLLPLITSQVAGGLLRIGPEHGNLRPSGTIQYQLHVKNLKELHLAGALNAEAQALKSERLLLAISGSGNINVPALEAAELNVQVSGAGDITIAGKVPRQSIGISGSGNYRASQCDSDNVAISISGSGDATVWARASLNASVSGSGDIKYYGSPQLSSHVSGAGGVHSLGNK